MKRYLVVLVVVAVAGLCFSAASPVASPVAAPRKVGLYENLLAVSPQWVGSYPDVPAGEVTVVYNINQLIQAFGQQKQKIDALEKRIIALEARLTPADPNSGE